ncbi:MAG TPA: aldo/keto reductase, partial [Rhizobacter sp.]|nr:aldo/keto reductase [Rhizobacter sp.]
LWSLPGGEACATNQVYYALSERGIEFDLLPTQRQRRMPTMAYSPLDQGRLAQHPVLQTMGARHGASATQMALAWVLKQPGVMAIPKAVQETHLRANLAAADLQLTPEDLAALDQPFPPPQRKGSLAMI